MFDLKTKIMIGIASSLLTAAIVLIVVVLCLYFKISKAIKAAKENDTMVENNCNPAKSILAKGIAAESCHTLRCCDECSMYADVDTLPPCFCGTNEGL